MWGRHCKIIHYKGQDYCARNPLTTASWLASVLAMPSRWIFTIFTFVAKESDLIWLLSPGWLSAALGLLEPRHHRRVWHHGAAGGAREAGLAGLQLRGKYWPVIGQYSQHNALSLVRRRRWLRPRAARSPANTTSTKLWGSRSPALRGRWGRQQSGFHEIIISY